MPTFIFHTLAPVFILIAVGAVAFRRGLLDERTLQGINRLACRVGLPALLFHGTATADYSGSGVWEIVMVTVAAGVVVAALAAVLAWRLGMNAVAAGTFVHVATRANLSFVGLPVLFYLIESRAGPEAQTLRTLSMLAFAPYLLFQNTAGIIALMLGRQRPGGGMWQVVVKEIVTQPLLVAVALGIAVGASGQPLPLFLDRSLDSIGAIASPIALIAIGASLLTPGPRAGRGPALAASMLKVFLMPLIGWFVGMQCGLTRDQLLVALVFLACPTGASSFSLVAELEGDQSMASSTIVVSTLLAIIPLALTLGLA